MGVVGQGEIKHGSRKHVLLIETPLEVSPAVVSCKLPADKDLTINREYGMVLPPPRQTCLNPALPRLLIELCGKGYVFEKWHRLT